MVVAAKRSLGRPLNISGLNEKAIFRAFIAITVKEQSGLMV